MLMKLTDSNFIYDLTLQRYKKNFVHHQLLWFIRKSSGGKISLSSTLFVRSNTVLFSLYEEKKPSSAPKLCECACKCACLCDRERERKCVSEGQFVYVWDWEREYVFMCVGVCVCLCLYIYVFVFVWEKKSEIQREKPHFFPFQQDWKLRKARSARKGMFMDGRVRGDCSCLIFNKFVNRKRDNWDRC